MGFRNLQEKLENYLFCRHWYKLIRGHPKLSGHLLVARTAIENPNWKWENWPSLKTLELKNENRLELRHTRTSVRTSPVFSAKYAIEAMNKICFNQCPSLEKVNLTVYFDLEELQFAANVQQQSFTGNLLRGNNNKTVTR